MPAPDEPSRPTPPPPGQGPPGSAPGGCLWAGLVAAIVLSGVVLWFATLRENPLFWRNIGGYPVALRDFVEQSFYPLGVTLAAGMALLGWALLFRNRSSAAAWLTQAALFTLCLIAAAAAAVVAFTNNVSNLWNGRPLHYHSWQDGGTSQAPRDAAPGKNGEK